MQKITAANVVLAIRQLPKNQDYYSGSLVKTDFLGNIMNEHNNLIPANINHAV